jgi:hypothetical protein
MQEMMAQRVPSDPQGAIDVAEAQQAEPKVKGYEIVVNGTVAVVPEVALGAVVIWAVRSLDG